MKCANICPTCQRAELAAFLRARRAQLTQRDVGLPEDMEPGRRRTPGLRREEVAELAGPSLTWYTWLEQGRKIAASSQVIDEARGRIAAVLPEATLGAATLPGVDGPPTPLEGVGGPSTPGETGVGRGR